MKINFYPSSRKHLWGLYYGKPGDAYNKARQQMARSILPKNQYDDMYNESLKSSDSNTAFEAYIMYPMEYGGIVDVVEDYAWTLSPKEARVDVPYIYMKELVAKNGAELQRALYSAHALIDSIKNVGEKFGIKDVKKTVINSTKSIITKSADFIKDTIPSVDNVADDITIKIKDAIDKNSKSNFDNIKHLIPYDMLYNCDETGWRYKFPLFEDGVATSPQNTYGEESNTMWKYVADLAENANKWGGGAVSAANTINNNMIRNTETPKIYGFNNQTPTINIKFPLINTIDEETAKRNYDLVQLLKYQSRPYRADKNTVLPTYIYEIIIPGFKYLPYAYIQNVDIKFQGVRRLMKTDYYIEKGPDNTPGKISKNITVICPEAYDITITLQGLTNDTQNFMIEYMENKRNLLPEV